MKTQNERVLERLQSGKTITSIEAAYMDPPIADLRKRISELRHQGYEIKDRDCVSKSKAHFKRYYMEV